MKVQIQELEKSEIDLFKKVYLAALNEDWETLEGKNDKDEWERNFRYWINNGFSIFLLKRQQEIIGYIAGDTSRLLHLWISSEYRNKGFGVLLINYFLESQAKHNHYTFKFKAYKDNIEYFKNLDCDLVAEFNDFATFTINRYG